MELVVETVSNSTFKEVASQPLTELRTHQVHTHAHSVAMEKASDQLCYAGGHEGQVVAGWLPGCITLCSDHWV